MAVLSFPPVPVMRRLRFSMCMFRALPPMKVSSASTSPESFLEAAFGESKPQAVIHEPCGLLSDAEITRSLARTDAVLAVHNEPQRSKPLVQSER